MKCPVCSIRMRCLDTRWNKTVNQTRRKWKCSCGSRGTTIESWESTPTKVTRTLKPKPDFKKIDVEKSTDKLMTAFYGRLEKPKKQKQVEVKHKPTKAMFEDVEDSRNYDDYSDLGIDIPKGDDW